MNFAESLGWQRDQLLSADLAASVEITYRRGEESVTLRAVAGRTLLRLESDGGVQIMWTDRDFIVSALDLVLNDAPVTPQRGDVIEEDGRKYEVLQIPGEQSWRWTDSLRTMMRIHTKEIPSGECED